MRGSFYVDKMLFVWYNECIGNIPTCLKEGAVTREEMQDFVDHVNAEMTALARNPNKKSLAPFLFNSGNRIIGKIRIQPTTRKLKTSVSFELDNIMSKLINSLIAGNWARFLSGDSERDSSIVVDWQFESAAERAA